MVLYTVFDELSKKSGPIFEQANDELALRSFEVMLETIPKAVSRDLRLYKLGTYDADYMKCELFPAPEVVDASSLLNPKE